MWGGQAFAKSSKYGYAFLHMYVNSICMSMQMYMYVHAVTISHINFYKL